MVALEFGVPHVAVRFPAGTDLGRGHEIVPAPHSGRLLLEVGASEDALEAFELLPCEAVRLTAGVRHRMTALEDAVVLEASTPELDDVVRLDDQYGRTGTSAP